MSSLGLDKKYTKDKNYRTQKLENVLITENLAIEARKWLIVSKGLKGFLSSTFKSQ